jgi:hypothetical protein
MLGGASFSLQRRLQPASFWPFVILALAPAAPAQTYANNIPIDHPAIHYSTGPLDNPVARLQSQLETGRTHLDFADTGSGYLLSLLRQLGVNVDSQAPSFFQRPAFSPQKSLPATRARFTSPTT